MSKKLSVSATIFLRFIFTCLFSLLTNEFFWTFFWTCSANCVFARTICANLTPTLKNECPKYFHTYFFKMIKTDNKIAGNVQKVLRRECVPETFARKNKVAGVDQCPKIKNGQCPKNKRSILFQKNNHCNKYQRILILRYALKIVYFLLLCYSNSYKTFH
jgi:hypothetical protein